MLTIGLFFAGLLVYALVSRLLDRASISAQIVMLVIGVGLGIAAKGTPEASFETEILGIAGELALILALVVDAARIDVGALRRTAGLPVRLLVIGLPLTIVIGTIAALVLPGISLLESLTPNRRFANDRRKSPTWARTAPAAASPMIKSRKYASGAAKYRPQASDHATAKTMPPTSPAQVLLGLMDGAMRGPRRRLPTA